LEEEKEKLKSAQEELLKASVALENARTESREMREGFEKVFRIYSQYRIRVMLL
jgi:hypothetical protein